jgi:septal ring factor EnvC (AmiA/AmiB activator)
LKRMFTIKKEENEMATMKQDLATLTRQIKALSVKLDKLTKAAAKLGAAKPAAKKPAAKKAAKKAVKKPVAKKKPAAKKPKAVTSIDKVFGFIRSAKAGINTATLEKKTGFNKKKVQNIIFKLKKQGKIKTKAKGIYVKA